MENTAAGLLAPLSCVPASLIGWFSSASTQRSGSCLVADCSSSEIETCYAISTVHISHQSGRFLLSPSSFFQFCSSLMPYSVYRLRTCLFPSCRLPRSHISALPTTCVEVFSAHSTDSFCELEWVVFDLGPLLTSCNGFRLNSRVLVPKHSAHVSQRQHYSGN